ncbi:MAG: hypothetical protein PQJ46_07445 [Spirochaetales bacterium]|nr:hypothetical protein [Spirochaetales bacterium]
MDELFNRSDWHNFVQGNKKSLEEEIKKYNGNKLLNTSEDDLVKYFYDKYFFNVPEINESEISVEQNEIDIDVSRDPMRSIWDRNQPFYIKGTKITFYIPFSGEDIFFSVQPSHYYMKRISGKILNGCIIHSISSPDLTTKKIQSNIEQYLREINEYINTQRKDSVPYNNALEGTIRRQLQNRKSKLLANQNLVSSLGFKLKENSAMPTSYSAPEVKRKNIKLPPASSEPYKPEPELLEKDYENILSILENMIHVMERSPTAFRNIDEESLRMHFIVQLNGHYEGNATGETFNYKGKTDILIRSNDKNIFIGECKFWKGKAQYLKTIDQILGYSSWKDTKVAVLIFNRNKSLSTVIKTIKEATIEHPNYKKTINDSSETKFKYRFSQLSDQNREITLTVMVFDVPSE